MGWYAAADWDSCSNCFITPDGSSAAADWDSCGSCSITRGIIVELCAAADWDSSSCGSCSNSLGRGGYWSCRQETHI